MNIYEVIAGYTSNHRYSYYAEAETEEKAKEIIQSYLTLFTIYDIKQVPNNQKLSSSILFKEMPNDTNWKN